MSKHGYSGYTLLVTVFLPLLILIWASCLVICLYKHIVARLERSRTGQCPSVRVVVENNNILPPPQQQQQHKQQQQAGPGQAVISSQYAPVTSHLASSLTMADFLKMKKDINLEDSLGPKYYPTAPISTIPEPPAAEVDIKQCSFHKNSLTQIFSGPVPVADGAAGAAVASPPPHQHHRQ